MGTKYVIYRPAGPPIYMEMFESAGILSFIASSWKCNSSRRIGYGRVSIRSEGGKVENWKWRTGGKKGSLR